MIPIPNMKPGASRETVIKYATERWAIDHPGKPLPDHFVLAVRGYYDETIQPAGNSIDMAGATQRYNLKPVLSFVSFMVMVFFSLVRTGTQKRLGGRELTGSHSLIDSVSSFYSVRVAQSVIRRRDDCGRSNLFGIRLRPITGCLSALLLVHVISFSRVLLNSIRILRNPFLCSDRASLLVSLPVARVGSLSGFGILTDRLFANFAMTLFASRGEPALAPRAFNKLLQLFLSSARFANFRHAEV